MKREIIIDSLCDTVRLFLFEDSELCESYFLSEEIDDIVGCVYLGSVVNISKSLNAAFIDIGLKQNAFLNIDNLPRQRESLKAGDRVIVQVDRQPTGNKGARLNTSIKLRGDLVVLLPYERCIKISSSIKDGAAREKLIATGRSLLEKFGYGLIVRTEAANSAESDIEDEYRRLHSVFQMMDSKAKSLKPPMKLYGSTDIKQILGFICRDATIKTDNKRIYEELSADFDIELTDNDIPLCDIYRCDKLFERSIRRRAMLPSGGNIVIDRTEAMTVIDVNSAGFGKNCKEETALETNLEAARAIMRLLRLRNLSGIIAVDFIDMAGKENTKLLEAELHDLKRRDRGKPVVYPMTEPGVILLTRKRCNKSAFEVFSEAEDIWRSYYKAAIEVRRKRAAIKDNPIIISAAGPLCGFMTNKGFIGIDGIYCVEDNRQKDNCFSISTAPSSIIADNATEIG